MTLINSYQAAGRAGDVIEQFFGDVDREIGGESPAEVVKSPGLDVRAELFVEGDFAFAPAAEMPGSIRL